MKKSIITLFALLTILFTLSACAPAETEDKVIKVGASPAPHASILEAVRPLIEEAGYTLEIVEFTDYVLPNTNLQEGELDANYFQHVPYLDSFNAENKTTIVSVLGVHFEPLGLYPGKTASLDAIQDGAKIAVPNDPSNEARALNLLQALGLITIDPAKAESATILDITSNPKNIEIVELVAEAIPAALPELDFAVINGNVALGANITATVLTTEDKDSAAAIKYANILAVKAGNETTEKTQVLIDALNSQTVKDYIQNNFYPVVISVTE